MANSVSEGKLNFPHLIGAHCMTNPLPKWAMRRYSILWNKFKSADFTHDAASGILNEKNPSLVSISLSIMRKNGWLDVKLDQVDSRKRIYTLKKPEQAVLEITG